MKQEFCQENALVIANTLFQQHKRRLYTWTSPDGQHQNHSYTVEVTNKFKELDLIDRVPEELWMEVCDIVQETGIKIISKKKKYKKQNGWLRRPYK